MDNFNLIKHYVKEKLDIAKQLEKEDDGNDHIHSMFIAGINNAYEDIQFEIDRLSNIEIKKLSNLVNSFTPTKCEDCGVYDGMHKSDCTSFRKI